MKNATANDGYSIVKRYKNAKRTAEIPAEERNEWGWPCRTHGWSFVGYAEGTSWWVKE